MLNLADANDNRTHKTFHKRVNFSPRFWFTHTNEVSVIKIYLLVNVNLVKLI